MNKLKKDELEEKILEGYNESQDLRKFVEKKVRGKGIKWSEENKSNANWTEMTKKVFRKIGKESGDEIEDTEENKELDAYSISDILLNFKYKKISMKVGFRNIFDYLDSGRLNNDSQEYLTTIDPGRRLYFNIMFSI